MKRNDSIDILKFIAALLVLNSHLDMLYSVDYKCLATGGALGDALFFFCSGFGLFLSSKPVGSFADWYKRRIRRIYPTVFSWAILTSAFQLTNRNMFSVLLYGGGWFVTAIMIFYVLFYFIKKYLDGKLWIPCLATVLLTVIWCTVFQDYSGESFTNIFSARFKSILFISFSNMLMGACVGRWSKKSTQDIKWSATAYLMITIGCVVAYYGILFVCAKFSALQKMQFFAYIPMGGFLFSLYQLLNCPISCRIYRANSVIHHVIYFVGALCLEMYICQYIIICFLHDLNVVFPLNIFFCVSIVIIVAYLLRVFSNIFRNIFDSQDRPWMEIFAI